ncbi:MAG: FG-GAP repeat protein [Phycisphaerales bacterium]|nr:FG-GAP repeat protein [Phycisphaerales bacterium]
MHFHRKTVRTILIASVSTASFAQTASAQVFFEEHQVFPSNGTPDDLFGWAIAMNDNIIAVSSVHDGVNGTDSGSVYVFQAHTRTQLARLIPDDGAARDNFGFSVATDNGLVVVGAYLDDDDGFDSGSVYIFDANTGAQLSKLHASDASAGDNFGISVAIDDGIIVVGAARNNDNGVRSGSAYVFDAETGAQLAKLLPNDGSSEDLFGLSVATQGGTVVVGVPNDDDNGSQSGSVYIFDAITGFERSKLIPTDGQSLAFFGGAIAIDNGTLAVGARFDSGSAQNAGAAYLFDIATGELLTKLVANDSDQFENFGSSIDIDGGIVAVGAWKDGFNGADSGAAYVFDASTGEQMFKMIATDGSSQDVFGGSIAIDNGVMVAGAYQSDNQGNNSGTVYTFPQLTSPCPADFNDDGEVNFFDVAAFINAFSNQCPE